MIPPHPAPRRLGRLAALAAAAALFGPVLAACGDGGEARSATSTPQTGTSGTGATTPDGDPAPATTPGVTAAPAGSFDQPIVLLGRPGDEDHLYLAERAGTVRRLTVADDGTLAADGDPLLDISDQTSVDAERGLLGLAFAEDGDTAYLSHTDPDGNSRVASYAMTEQGIDADSRQVLFEQDQPFPNHNGGNIVLGPDGLLWLGLGDGGSSDDPDNNAQNPDTYLGKLVRIDPAGGEPEIVVSGLRNPWRFSFDTDDSLWIGDVGQGAIEEVDHLPADEIEGADLGWSGYEGSEPYLDGDGRRPADPVMPVFEYRHDEGGNCSITGGFVYRGEAIPDLVGAYLFADYCAGAVRAVRLADDGTLAEELDLGVQVDQPISFGADQAGEPYVLSGSGAVVRLDAAG